MIYHLRHKESALSHDVLDECVVSASCEEEARHLAKSFDEAREKMLGGSRDCRHWTDPGITICVELKPNSESSIVMVSYTDRIV